MNLITRLFAEEWVHALAWTLLHSLWQGMLIALLVTLAFTLLRHRPPEARYGLALTGLALMVLSAVITFMALMQPHTGPAAGIVISGGTVEIIEIAPMQFSEGTAWWSSLFSSSSALLPLLVLAWMVGVAVLTLRSLSELLFLQHIRFQRSRPAPAAWQEKLDELAAALSLPTTIELRESLRISSPMVLGAIRPIILLPAGLIAQLPPRELEMVLAHELAHIRRHDYLVNLLQTMVETLFFFNPAAWWISSLIRAEREHCCDDAAIALLGDERAYVRTLGKIETYRQENLALAMSLLGPRGSVLGRMQRMLNGDQPMRVPFRLFWAALLVLTCGGLLALRPAGLPEPAPAGAVSITGWRNDTLPDGRQEQLAALKAELTELESAREELHRELRERERERQSVEQEFSLMEQERQIEMEAMQREMQLAQQKIQLQHKQLEQRMQRLDTELQRTKLNYQREMAREDPNQDRLEELEDTMTKIQEQRLDLQNQLGELDLMQEKERLAWTEQLYTQQQELMGEQHERQAELYEFQGGSVELQQAMEALELQYQRLQRELQRLRERRTKREEL